jgi:hypothetical protein
VRKEKPPRAPRTVTHTSDTLKKQGRNAALFFQHDEKYWSHILQTNGCFGTIADDYKWQLLAQSV